MRRLSLLAGALVVPVVPLLIAAPAEAVDHVICVNMPAGTTCDDASPATITDAIALANTGTADDTILVGPGTYTDGPYVLNGTVHGLTLKGTGQALTILEPPPGGVQTMVTANAATLQDVTVRMSSTTPTSDQGVFAFANAQVDHVTIDGAGTVSNTGLHLATGADAAFVSVQLPRTGGGRGVYGEGNTTLTDSDVTAGSTFGHSSSGLVDTISRVTLRAGSNGITVDAGTVDVDNTVIDLGTGTGTGLLASNANGSTSSKTINADHVTIVGGGAGSKGAWAWAARPTTKQTSSITMTSSIVTGPAVDLRADAGNDGAQGGASTATVAVSYSDYHTGVSNVGANGAGGVVPGPGTLDVDPAFVDAAAGNYRLSAASPAIDVGDPAGGLGPDRDGAPRSVDGDGNSTVRTDMGAFERQDGTPPQTTVVSGPSGPTSDATPTFAFSADEVGATFECRVDQGVESACSSPFTTSQLADGAHEFSVRATDTSGNVDATPAVRNFTVDTVAPDTTIVAGPSGLSSDPTPTFSFGSDPGATFECKVDAAAYAPCASPYTVATLADGAHVLSVRATDAVSNADATPATRAFTVDTAAPDTTITKPAKRTTKAKVKLVFSSEAGATFQCQVDGKAWKACTSPLKLKVKLGKHVVLVRAVDAVGNVDATAAKVTFKRVPKP